MQASPFYQLPALSFQWLQHDIRGYYKHLNWALVFTWALPSDANFAAGWGMLLAPAVSSPPSFLFCYISLLDSLIWNTFFWQLVLIFLYFELGLQTRYPLAQMLFLRIVVTVFPTSYRMKSVCSCWVWKLSNDACLPNLIPSASFLKQSDSLEEKADQLLHTLPLAALVKQQACAVS